MRLVEKLFVHSKDLNYLKISGKRIGYIVKRRNIKYPRLEFLGDTLFLIVPKHRKDYKKLIQSKRKWIIEKYEKISKILREGKNLVENFIIFGKKAKVTIFKNGKVKINDKIIAKDFIDLKNKLKNLLSKKISEIALNYSRKLHVKHKKIYIRQQRTKWSSCSSKGNLTFNLKLISLPEDLISYIVFHEIVHLIEKNHSEKFLKIIKNEFSDFKKREEEMMRYWIILNKNIWWKRLLG